MLVSRFITRVNYALRGTDEDAPEQGDETWTYWVEVLNWVKDNLYEDTSKQWRASFSETAPDEPGTVATTGTTTLTGTNTFFTDYRAGDKITVSGETVRTIASITGDTSLTVTVAFSNTASSKTYTHSTIIATGDQTYSAHRSFLGPSDRAYVTKTDGNRVYFDIIQPQERTTTTQQMFLAGENPETFNFTDEIASTDDIVGGTLTVPGYYIPPDVTANTDTVPLPSPNWGVFAVAAEIAFSDITYEDKAGDLNAKANALNAQMAARNRRGTHRNPRTSAYNVKRIRSTETR